MPQGRPATLAVTVTPLEFPPVATLAVTVTNPAVTEHTLICTVSRALQDSYLGTANFHRLRVKLAGDWLPDEDLGPVEIREDLDSHSATADVTLYGAAYSLLATTNVWARVAVEIWLEHGQAGALVEEIRFAGTVSTCDQEGGPCTVVVRCSDAAHLDQADVCLEVEPFAGLTRGAIVEIAAAAAGIENISVPPGAVYEKPMQAVGTNFFSWLREWGEPEGWHIRRVPDNVERWEVWKPELITAPREPDAIWGPGVWEQLRSVPAEPSPSRWVIYGTGAVSVDEQGLTTTVTRTIIERPYAPPVAVSRQLSDGSIVSTGISGETPTLRKVVEIIDEVGKVGNTLVQQFTTEYGYRNLAAPKWRTPTGGTAPGGYTYTPALIDDEGNYVVWPKAKWIATGWRFVYPKYTDAGDPTTVTTRIYGWGRRTKGVQTVGGGGVTESYVGDDEQSYDDQPDWSSATIVSIEFFGLLEEQRLFYTYSSAGVVTLEEVDTYGYRAIKGAIDVGGHFLLHDGTAQTEIVANWRRWKRQSVSHIIENGLTRGAVETEETYLAPPKIGGTYDWGDFEANVSSERFQITDRRNVRYNLLTEDTFEEIVTDSSGTRMPKKVFGRLPLPRFRLSAWTKLVQAPIEVTYVDEDALALFGPRREVIDHPYIQSAEEALWIVRLRRSRLLAHRHEVPVPISPLRKGATVLLVDPSTGLNHRCMVQRLAERWNGPSAFATYTLEQTIAPTA